MGLVRKSVASPVGGLLLLASDAGLCAVLWEKTEALEAVREPGWRAAFMDAAEEPEHGILLQAETELEEYFAGRREAFSVPLDVSGTPFQRRVWELLREIPYGETRAYGELARRLGDGNATRAVGAANGRNPLAIVVPCHRVVGAAGKLTGFAGGLSAKAWLLEMESAGRRLFR